LIQAVLLQEGPTAYGEAEGEARQSLFENDLGRIQHGLRADIYFDRQVGGK